MATRQIAVDYGERRIDIEVPQSAAVVEFQDPPLLAEPVEAVRAALRAPLGAAPLAELARPGMRVAIGFDDITRPALPAQTILPVVVEELNRAGVKDRDIVFVCACSNHRKNTRTELAHHLGPAIFNRFWPLGNIRNHDCADPSELVGFGVTDHGRVVEHNRTFVEADLQIYQGNVSAQAWRGYTGTGAVIGLASTRSIASHHSYHTIPDPAARKKPSGEPRAPGVKDDITACLEQATGKRVFYVNAVSGSGGRLAGVFAGHATAVTPPAWDLAQRCFSVESPQADVLVVGLPRSYSYGSADNTLIAAVGALVPPRYSPATPVLREGGVVIAVSPTRGEIDPRRYPSYAEAIELYGRHHSLRELVDFEDEFNGRPDYQRQYRHGYGYPPLHAFWVLYELEYGLARAGAVIMAGTSNPGAFRSLGLSTAPDFAAAWKMARKHVGDSPSTVVAPSFWSRPRIKFVVNP